MMRTVMAYVVIYRAYDGAFDKPFKSAFQSTLTKYLVVLWRLPCLERTVAA